MRKFLTLVGVLALLGVLLLSSCALVASEASLDVSHEDEGAELLSTESVLLSEKYSEDEDDHTALVDMPPPSENSKDNVEQQWATTRILEAPTEQNDENTTTDEDFSDMETAQDGQFSYDDTLFEEVHSNDQVQSDEETQSSDEYDYSTEDDEADAIADSLLDGEDETDAEITDYDQDLLLFDDGEMSALQLDTSYDNENLDSNWDITNQQDVDSN